LKAGLQLFALPDLPMVQAGDDLAVLLSAAMARADLAPNLFASARPATRISSSHPRPRA
jgi:hypothetical protein